MAKKTTIKKGLIAIFILCTVLGTVFVARNLLINWIGWNLTTPKGGYPTPDWETSTLAAEGMEPASIQAAYEEILKSDMLTHGILIVRHGKLVDETYFAPYSRDVALNVHSCTKSIVSILTGIALEEGYLTSLDQRVVDFFPETSIKNLDDAKRRITLRHLLTMSPGLAVNHPDEAMRRSADWGRYAVGLPMIDEPGRKFNYSDATAHLMGIVLQKAIGTSLEEYARKKLFDPLGIQVSWPRDPQGYSLGCGEINMTMRDMAKIGYLVLRRGKWGDRQIVGENWVRESTARHIDNGRHGYGYYWWLGENGFYASGAGEQTINVLPFFDTVMVCANGYDFDRGFGFGGFTGALRPFPLTGREAAERRLVELERAIATVEPARPGADASGTIKRIHAKRYEFPAGNPLKLATAIPLFTEGAHEIRFFDDRGGSVTMRARADGLSTRDDTRAMQNDTVFRSGRWISPTSFELRLESSTPQTFLFRFDAKTMTIESRYRGRILFEGLTGIVGKSTEDDR